MVSVCCFVYQSFRRAPSVLLLLLFLAASIAEGLVSFMGIA
jgi:hypothetical protein